METYSKLFLYLTEKYPIGTITNHKAMYGGYVGDNLVLTTSKNTNYFLKKYGENAETVLNIHKIINILKGRGINTLLPIESFSGTDYFIFKDAVYALFPFIELPQYKRGTSDIPNKVINAMGNALGKIHSSVQDIKIESLRVYKKKQDDFEKNEPMLQEALITIKDVSDKTRVSRLLSLKSELYKEFKGINIDLDHIQLCHGDYHIENAFFNPKTNDFIVFDFDKAMYLPIGLELFKSAFVSFYGNERFIKTYIKKYFESCNKIIDQSYLLRSWQFFIKENISSTWTLKEILIKKNPKALDFIDSEIWRMEFISQNYTKFSEFIQNL